MVTEKAKEELETIATEKAKEELETTVTDTEKVEGLKGDITDKLKGFGK